MSLKMYQIPRVRLDFGTGDDDRFVMLRALSPADVFAIFRAFTPEVESFVSGLEKMRVAGDVNLLDMGQIATQILDKIPGVGAHAIALCADEPDAVEQAKGLPLPVQMDGLEKIFMLTFTGDGSIKKALEVAIRMFQGTRGLIETDQGSRSEPLKSTSTSPSTQA